MAAHRRSPALASGCIRAGAAGRIPGGFFKCGDPWHSQTNEVAFIHNPGWKVAVPSNAEDAVGLLREHRTRADVMLADQLGAPVTAHIVREVPAGSRDLPSMALGAAGGGDIAVDMRDQAGTTAVEGVFQLELSLPPDTPVAGIGERVYVRLRHGSESLWRQWSRSVRQLLLSHLQT